jgi:hypothetical protein
MGNTLCKEKHTTKRLFAEYHNYTLGEEDYHVTSKSYG